MKPDSTISAIRPSMIALVSTTMWGSPAAGVRSPSAAGGGRARSPRRRSSRSWRLATVSPSIPRPRNERDPQRQPLAVRTGKASGSPSRRPISSPRSRPATAVDELGRREVLDWRMSQPAGTTVRYGRIAKPTTIQATTQAARSRRRIGVGEEAAPTRRARARRGHRWRPRASGYCGSRLPRIGLPGVHRTAGGPGGRQPSIAASGVATATRAGREGGLDRLAQASRRRRCSARDVRASGAARRARHDRAAEPEPRRLAQPAVEADDRAQLAEQPDLADRHGPGGDRPIAERRGEGQGERQVQAGSSTASPPARLT